MNKFRNILFLLAIVSFLSVNLVLAQAEAPVENAIDKDTQESLAKAQQKLSVANQLVNQSKAQEKALKDLKKASKMFYKAAKLRQKAEKLQAKADVLLDNAVMRAQNTGLLFNSGPLKMEESLQVEGVQQSAQAPQGGQNNLLPGNPINIVIPPTQQTAQGNTGAPVPGF